MVFPAATAEAPSLPPTIEDRAVRATLACVARHGLAKTTFDDVARSLIGAGSAVAPALARFLPAERVDRAGEWLARVVLTHALSPTRPIDLTDEAATRALVRELVLPGLIGPKSAT